jgi:hypothetical protein
MFNDVTLLALSTIKDNVRGSLGVAECGKDIPFDIKRVFYLYDLPLHGSRGQHAHRKQNQFLICLSGSIQLSTIYKNARRELLLSAPDQGVYLPAMTWLDIEVLEVPALCLVLASGLYDENDYIRNFALFQAGG